MLQILGLLVAIALLIFLAYRGVGAIAASLICSLVVILTNGIPLWQGFAQFYAGGFAGFMGAYFLVFVTSALFAKAMQNSGSAQAIAYKFIEWFGTKRAILILTLTTAVLTYGGVSLFVVIFAVYPIAMILLKEADISKRILPGVLAFGAATFTMSALPASPQLTNIIPSQILGTSLTAAPGLGIFASVLLFAGGYWYLTRYEKKLRAEGIGFVPGPTDDMSKFENIDKDKLPPAWTSFLPMLLLLLVIAFVKGFEPTQLIVYAMMGATTLVFALNWSRIVNKKQTINDGLRDGSAIISISVIIGFGAVVQNAPAFQDFIAFALGLDMNVYISAILGTEIVAGITGSSSGGLTIFLSALGQKYVDMGANPEVLHRLTAIAAGGLDTLPHAGGIFILLGVTGQGHKEAYGPIFWTTVVLPIAVAFICAIVAIALF